MQRCHFYTQDEHWEIWTMLRRSIYCSIKNVPVFSPAWINNSREAWDAKYNCEMISLFFFSFFSSEPKSRSLAITMESRNERKENGQKNSNIIFHFHYWVFNSILAVFKYAWGTADSVQWISSLPNKVNEGVGLGGWFWSNLLVKSDTVEIKGLFLRMSWSVLGYRARAFGCVWVWGHTVYTHLCFTPQTHVHAPLCAHTCKLKVPGPVSPLPGDVKTGNSANRNIKASGEHWRKGRAIIKY